MNTVLLTVPELYALLTEPAWDVSFVARGLSRFVHGARLNRPYPGGRTKPDTTSHILQRAACGLEDNGRDREDK